MKIGVNLITFGPGASEDALARWAGFAEAVGYHFMMLGDHVTITADVQGRYPAPFYDPFTTLAWLAGLTRRVELGFTVIVLPYRHPLETARMAATLDRISGGRLIFGIGVGWARQEFEVLGLPFEKRGAMTDDYLGALKAAWTQDVASYQGRFVSFKEIYTAPRPLQRPHPPIWVGGSSEAALRRTVLHGDAWHPIRSRIAFLRDEGVPRLRAIAEKEGRPVPALCPRIRLRLTDSPLPEETRLAGEGTMDQVRRDFAALEKLGVPYLCLDTFADDVEGSRNHERAWRMLTSLAERAFDLDRRALR
ncbi:MAG TPA: TIGR03619 family F420-dependent LLM class oxidoreductase [Methylomirabilota bacterium]|jgi:probable F420-dependent oxidoreductase|nr:TIGR03619 family F420-dependent LLM class oxidoreductase [Methylomirabilota bacterium]